MKPGINVFIDKFETKITDDYKQNTDITVKNDNDIFCNDISLKLFKNILE